MWLTGYPDRAPLLAPAPLASCAAGALDAFRRVASVGPLRGAAREVAAAELGRLDAAALLGEHAAAFGHERRGNVSPGGSCRLLRAADGHLAVNLARPDDLDLLPAWLGPGEPEDPWSFVARGVAPGRVEELVARGRLLGLPVAAAAPPPETAPPWLRIPARGKAQLPEPGRVPLVVDLTSLWAGPLCTHLLSLAGARVIKLESLGRPDGTRRGAPLFFDLLNGDKESVALDFESAAGRQRLEALLAAADIVVEAARPRALRQLGIDAESWVAERPGRTWVSISGYGRREPEASWVAFGDDAGVAAGLAAATGQAARAAGVSDGEPLFCGDALADPLAGIHAALAALTTWNAGGGRLLDLSLVDVTGHALSFAAESEPRCGAGRVVATGDGGWEVVVDGVRQAVLRPRMREPRARSVRLGAHTTAVLGELGIG
jgi:hypothetical protein